MITWLKYGLLLPLVIFFTNVNGQSQSALLDSAYYLYEYEKFDEAQSVFQLVYKKTESNENLKLEALSGLLKISVFKVKLAAADSLFTLGNSLLVDPAKISTTSRLKFNQAAAELYRAEAKFDAALEWHKKVLLESKSLTNEPLITAYANLYIAATLERISKSDSALIYAKEALAQFLKLYPEDHVKLSAV